MTYDDRTNRPQTPHNIILEGRSTLSVSGVEEVERFDETEIVMYTSRGTLVVRGDGLHIEKLSLDGGELKVMGNVEALLYEDEGREKGGLFSHLFR
jgi:sporulation protein YabP